MRDPFDHYFAGWVLFPDPTPEEKEQFAKLVETLGRSLSENADLAEEWRVHPFDGKKDAFLVFYRKYVDRFGVDAAWASLAERIAR